MESPAMSVDDALTKMAVLVKKGGFAEVNIDQQHV